MNVILPERDQGIGASRLAAIRQAEERESNRHNPKKTKLDVWDGITPLPVLYLLHGMSDDHTTYCRRTSVERYVAGRKVAVVMPDAGNSFYSDEVHGYRYWEFISEELPLVVKSFFKISDRREETFVAGHSMGSFGAAKLALNHPDRYSKAAMLSGGIFLADVIDRQPDVVDRVFGSATEISKGCNDLPRMAKELAESKGPRPEFFTACGTKDMVYESHRKMAPYLKQLGFSVVDREQEGAFHEWSFWDSILPEVIAWMGIV